MVVCRYSKMVQYLPCTKDTNAPELADRLIEGVFYKFGSPRSIMSDRDSLFTSAFWSTFCYYAQVKRRLSTAYHPETDGQTERHNQVLECYLRCYINHEQDDWIHWLPSAEYAYNQSTNSVTKKSPFEMVYRYSPK